ncbi:uncharacterized protein AB675_1295 [Cyphellophora attinorum]|uniref:Clr5 domain-containing protein n=1 Tax=Cyphellophora attinorum TaxID=1664694 RepID=A0A0N1H3Y8_9EURO|nr:uncharacterized protein AB675_1295 [Phialophora attinorum]KPI35734.1 hypothetical protein AB675_1295 [Phialophora attinorum]
MAPGVLLPRPPCGRPDDGSRQWSGALNGARPPDTEPGSALGSTRTPSIRLAVWNAHRAIIEELYVRQDMNLAQLRQYMATVYHFYATTAMFKRQFAVWKRWKNYRHGQKKQILGHLASFDTMSDRQSDISGGDKYSAIMVNDQPVKCARLVRKVQQSGRTRPLTPPPGISNTDLLRVVSTANRDSTEVLLHAVSRYYAWYFDASAAVVRDYTFRGPMNVVFPHIASARRVIATDIPTAMAMLNVASGSVAAAIQAAPFQLLQHILSELGQWQWPDTAAASAARMAMMRFMCSISSRVWGAHHPLVSMLRSLIRHQKTTDDNRGTLPPIISLISTTSKAKMAEPIETAINVQNYLGDALFHAGDLDGAASIYSGIIRLSSGITTGRHDRAQCSYQSDIYRTHHRGARRAMKNLGWVRFKQGLPAVARPIFLEVLHLTEEAYGTVNGDFEGVSTCRYLAVVADEGNEHGLEDEAEAYFRLAFEGLLRYSGPDSSDVWR